MLQENEIPAVKVDLTNCDREPIHIPGYVQPHGFLLALNPQNLAIEKVSENIESFTGKKATDLLGKPLATLESVIVPARSDSSLTNVITLGKITGNFEQLNPQKVIVSGKEMFLICHQHKDHLICEVEHFQSDDDNITLQKIMGNALAVIQSSSSFELLLNHVASLVKEITGYSRIMIYKFHKDQHGEVVAETKDADLETWLHLHYPASDIPQQARQLYRLNLVRIIADVDATTSPVLSEPNKRGPLDLTHSTLRAVSPIHIEYLQNMGVGASFSISLMSKDELWGLIACHNTTPRFINYNSRVACKFIGQLFSAALEFKVNEGIEEKNNKHSQSQLILFEQLVKEMDPVGGLVNQPVTLLDMNSASGVAFCYEGKIHKLGKVPGEDDINRIIDWLRRNKDGNFFQTNSLPQLFPEAKKFAAVASGIMVTEIAHDMGEFIIWFKHELIQNIEWAGQQDKDSAVTEDGSIRINPRRSFERWTQEVKYTSEEWTNNEISGAMKMREDVIQVINKKAGEIRKLNELLKTAYDELDTFSFTISHDLRTPLSSIKNYSEIILEDHGNEFSDEAKELFTRVIRGTDKMTSLIKDVLQYSRVGRADMASGPIDMKKLLEEIREELVGLEERNDIKFIIKNTPSLIGDKTMVMQLFTNLVGNAVKYSTYLGRKDAALVEIDGSAKDGFVVYTIQDNGIGIDMKYATRIFDLFKRLDNVKNIQGTGVGLAIVKRIIEKHRGKIWLESRLDHGTKFYIAIPEKQSENA
jgi:light-regulated signal transduction histidine kinase (bacteriophytochrome)